VNLSLIQLTINKYDVLTFPVLYWYGNLHMVIINGLISMLYW
jgi:hypothetical protein